MAKPIPPAAPPAPSPSEVSKVRRWIAFGDDHEVWTDASGDFHRLDGPAKTIGGKDGWKTESYYRHGVRHREDGPAEVEYDEQGNLRIEEWRRSGQIHRIDGPAYSTFWADGSLDGVPEWWVDGEPRKSRAEAIAAVAGYDTGRLYFEFARSRFAEILDTGEDPRVFLPAIAAGVQTVEGLLEVATGAPVEWVLAHEEGAASA